jgi:transcriptional regulator with XRE-family HTH domain
VKIGDRARIARREMKLTQPKFVALLKMHLPEVEEKAYSTWETGTTPSNVIEVSEALEKVTGYPWTWFLRGVYAEPIDPDDGLSGDTPRKITNVLLASASQNVTFADFGRASQAAA